MYTNLQSYKQALTTLTGLDAGVVKQKFYTLSLPDFIQLDIGNKAFDDSIYKWISFEDATDGYDGFQTDNTPQAKMVATNVGYSGVNHARFMWNKYCYYNLKDLEQLRVATAKGETNFDFIGDKLEARKRNFDLMMQECVFLGNKVFKSCKGLLNNDEVAVDTTDLPAPLSDLTGAQLQTVPGNMLRAFANQAEKTALPNRLVIPFNDYLGLSTSTSAEFPIKTKLQYLEDAFKGATGNNDFKILYCAYAEASRNDSGRNIYCLYNKDPEVLVFDYPVEYKTTQFGTLDNYTFYNVGYAQVGGTRIFRPAEVLYFNV